MPKSRLRQLLKLVRVFGMAAGIRLWLGLCMQQIVPGSQPLALVLPGLRAPVSLRRPDLEILWQIMIMQENDFSSLPQAARVNEIHNRILAEGKKPVIVDCGGHIGLSALWFASRFPDALIYSVEPDSANFKLLQKNVAAYPNITPVNGGIWNESCRLEVTNPGSGSASFRVREMAECGAAGQSTGLRGYSIEEIAAQGKGSELFLVKMDIEGAESQVFKEPTEWLKTVSVLIIELHDWLMPGQGTSRNLLRRLGEHEFDVVLRGENLILFQSAGLP
jgi:FkbM family methyltransferase